MRDAKRIIVEKRDNIGDFVLATAFLNEGYRYWTDRDVSIVCTAAVAPLAKALYPRWKIQIGSDLATWGDPREMRQVVGSWPSADLMLNLRE